MLTPRGACVIAAGYEGIGHVLGDHDVSHHWGAGAHDETFGMAPRSKTSTRIMGPPQQGHGVGGVGSAGAVSCIGAGCAGSASSARALATLSARAGLANKP